MNERTTVRGGRTTARSSSGLALTVAATIGSVTALGGLLMWRNRSVIYGNDEFLWGLFTATSAAYVVAGVAILRRAPAHVIGWLCLGIAGVLELGLTLTQYAILAIRVDPGSLPAPGLALVVAETTPILTLTGIVLILHLFPTGRPVGPRWRPLVAATLIGQALFLVVGMLEPHRITDVWSDELSHAGASATNPLGIHAVGSLAPLRWVGLTLYLVGAVGSLVSFFVRRRRASPDERRQLRWLASVARAAAAWIVVLLPFMVALGPNSPVGGIFWIVITPLVALGPPAAIGIGIVKYRLFDIELVIRKTVIVSVVVVTLLGLYLAVLALATVGPASRIVVGIALLVVTFAPVRRAARSIADRAAYGRRASSYDVLSDFSGRIAETYAADDILPRMAAVLERGTGARAATVWLRVGSVLQPAATAGEDAGPIEAVAVVDDSFQQPANRETVEVRHQGTLLGALSVAMPANDPLDPARRRLIEDMARQAGLVLQNVRLIEELRASRQRLVAAQDEERRKIERNIHDGAQQQLVALAVKARLARRLGEKDPARSAEILEQIEGELSTALEDLRDLARGIYPPLLADKGLPAALEAQARRAPVPVHVETGDVGRFSRDAESAAYFSCLEAMQNVAKYARASSVTVRLSNGAGELRFEVIDDGVGFDPASTGYGTGLQGIRDRLDAVGGSLEVRSAPGAGTTLVGRIPPSRPGA